MSLGPHKFVVCYLFINVHVEFYLRFKSMHPKHIVGKQTFEGLKLFFVKPMKERNTCYIYHIEMEEL